MIALPKFALLLLLLLTCESSLLTLNSSGLVVSANAEDPAANTCAWDDETCRSTTTTDPPYCGLYMAESTIPNAGWGVYSTDYVPKGSSFYSMEMVIPVFDFGRCSNDRVLYMSHQRITSTQTLEAAKKKQKNNPSTSSLKTTLETWLLYDYLYSHRSGVCAFDADDVLTTIPGFGSLVNGHPGYPNLEVKLSTERIIPPLTTTTTTANTNTTTLFQDIRKDIRNYLPPDAGSFTSYHNQSFLIRKDVHPGQELFVDYGEGWYAERLGEHFPVGRDFRNSRAFRQHIYEAIFPNMKPTLRYRSMSSVDVKTQRAEYLNDLLTIVTDVMTFTSSVEGGNQALRNAFALDKQYYKSWYENFLQKQRKENKNNDDDEEYNQKPNGMYSRSQAWLSKNGLCLDHIEPKLSLVVPNQKGAFAKRFLPKDSIVAPAPVIHMSRDHLQMLMLDSIDKDMVLWKGYQLLLNYAYGHPSTSLVFFPYSPFVNYINHYQNPWNQTTTTGGQHQPNIKVQWSSKMSHPEWLHTTTAAEVLEKRSVGFMMEYVALRDIQPGEEIVLDYGENWVQAWNQHVHEWTKDHPTNTSSTTTSTIPTADTLHQKQDWDPNVDNIPPWIETRCFIEYNASMSKKQEDDKADTKLEGGQPRWYNYIRTTAIRPIDSVPCEVLSSSTTTTTTASTSSGEEPPAFVYKIAIVLEVFPDGSTKKPLYVQNVPREAIIFVEKKYTSYATLRHSFRHYIELPDDMIPHKWKDLLSIEEQQQQEEEEDEEETINSAVNKKKKKQDSNGSVESSQSSSSNHNKNCGIYIAESTLASSNDNDDEKGTLGIFTGNIHTDIYDSILHGELVIQVEDFIANNRLHDEYLRLSSAKKKTKKEKDTTSTTSDLHWILGNYSFDPTMTKANFDGVDIESILPGIGMLAQKPSSSVISNVEFRPPINTNNKNKYVVNAIPGTITTYENAQFVASLSNTNRNNEGISPGTELFMDDDFFSSFKKTGKQSTKTEATQQQQQQPDYGKRSLDWLHKNGVCVDNIKPGRTVTDGVSAFSPTTMDSTSDGYQNGNGRGAFATRSLTKGQLIAPMPVLQLSKHQLFVYQQDLEKNNGPTQIGKQMLLNYCYGHPQSSLLLFPYSPMVNYINHAPTTRVAISDNGSNHNVTTANAKIQWLSSTSSLSSSILNRHHNPDWFHKRPKEILAQDHPGLVMELVATRDIQPNEEIFIDYGSHWESAWNEFVDYWKEKQQQIDDEHAAAAAAAADKRKRRAADQNDWLQWIPTEKESKTIGDLENNRAISACYLSKSLQDQIDQDIRNKTKSGYFDNNKMSEQELPEYLWDAGGSKDIYRTTQRAYPCKVFDRTMPYHGQDAYDRYESIRPLTETYKVRVEYARELAKDDDDDDVKKSDTNRQEDKNVPVNIILFNIPRRAIEFFDSDYTSPNYIRDSFRNEIGLPDSMVPDAWKDLA